MNRQNAESFDLAWKQYKQILHWYIVYFNAPFNNANIYVIIARILFPLLCIF